ncbi:MAG: hypothetical protein K0Q90_4023, partial [Paenibacillaceae bacterium]|nr:hypothetical protein [Paenibacillaceae bacterium]
SRHRTIRFKTDGMPVTRRNSHHITPTAYIALTLIISANSHHCAIRFKSDGTAPACLNRYNITPTAHVALAILIPANCRHRTVRLKTDGMSIADMAITRRNSHHITPAAYLTLAVCIIAHSRYRAIKLDRQYDGNLPLWHSSSTASLQTPSRCNSQRISLSVIFHTRKKKACPIGKLFTMFDA